MSKLWTMEENKTAIGYLKFAIEDLNARADIPLTQEQQSMLIGSMNYAFDMHTEKEAYEKG